MMLLPYINEPATGSRMPSMSTGGAPTKAMMKQMVAARSVGIMRIPNQPTYRRLLVEVTHSQKLLQEDSRERVIVVDIVGVKKPEVGTTGIGIPTTLKVGIRDVF